MKDAVSPEGSAKMRWRNLRRWMDFSWQAASFIGTTIRNLENDRDGRRRDRSDDDTMTREFEIFTPYAKSDGLRIDTERYIRMNRTNRQEVIVPKLGLIGMDWCLGLWFIHGLFVCLFV